MTMNETYVTISGNIVGEPVVRATKANVPFVTFRVASNMRRVDTKTGEYIDAGTNFVNVTAFRGLGVNLANSLKKGQPVIVHGRMRINQWDNGERSGTTVEIDATKVGHDLSLGQATFVKVAKSQLNQSDRMADPAVQDANDQLDRDAALAGGAAGGAVGGGSGEDADVDAGDDFLDADDEPRGGGFVDGDGQSIELVSADTDDYETVGAIG